MVYGIWEQELKYDEKNKERILKDAKEIAGLTVKKDLRKIINYPTENRGIKEEAIVYYLVDECNDVTFNKIISEEEERLRKIRKDLKRFPQK